MKFAIEDNCLQGLKISSRKVANDFVIKRKSELKFEDIEPSQ